MQSMTYLALGLRPNLYPCFQHTNFCYSDIMPSWPILLTHLMSIRTPPGSQHLIFFIASSLLGRAQFFNTRPISSTIMRLSFLSKSRCPHQMLSATPLSCSQVTSCHATHNSSNNILGPKMWSPVLSRKRAGHFLSSYIDRDSSSRACQPSTSC